MKHTVGSHLSFSGILQAYSVQHAVGNKVSWKDFILGFGLLYAIEDVINNDWIFEINVPKMMIDELLSN
jgi:hypothetical protein